MGAVRPPLHQRGRGDDPAERQARRDALGEQDHVGGDAEGLGRERVAGAAHAALHLVEDQHDAVLVAAAAQPLEPRDRRHDVAALAEHRLDDHGADVAVRQLQGQHRVELGQRGPDRLRLARVLTGDAVVHDGDAAEQRLVALAVLPLRGGEGGGRHRPAVEGPAEGDDARPCR